jgi:hypothetical protein
MQVRCKIRPGRRLEVCVVLTVLEIYQITKRWMKFYWQVDPEARSKTLDDEQPLTKAALRRVTHHLESNLSQIIFRAPLSVGITPRLDTSL